MGESIAEVAAIIPRLTKGQRRAFTHGSELGCVPRSEVTRKALIIRGYAAPLTKHQRALNWTPLGIAIRNYLTSRGKSHDC